jgi:hypothetical protein
VATYNPRVPAGALEAIANVADNCVSLSTLIEPAVTPLPVTATAVRPATKSVPDKRTLVLLPAFPVEGVTKVSDGACGRSVIVTGTVTDPFKVSGDVIVMLPLKLPNARPAVSIMM